MRAIDDCHQHNSKLAPTLRPVTELVEVSLANLVHFVFSRHELRFRDSTRSSFGMFFRPRTHFRDERFGFVSFVEPTSDVSVASPSKMTPFGFALCFTVWPEDVSTTLLVKEGDFRAPKRLPSIAT